MSVERFEVGKTYRFADGGGDELTVAHLGCLVDGFQHMLAEDGQAYVELPAEWSEVRPDEVFYLNDYGEGAEYLCGYDTLEEALRESTEDRLRLLKVTIPAGATEGTVTVVEVNEHD